MRTEKAQFEAAAGLFSQLLESDLPEVAFAGRSNVGKSSLINKILNRKSLARISSQPGKTATINFYNIETLRLVDLPGYGFAKVSHADKDRWSELINGYFEDDRQLKLVIQLVDSRHPPSKDDLIMLEYLREMGVTYIIVLTKIDKLNKTQRERRLSLTCEELGEEDMSRIVPFSSVTGEGVEDVRRWIEFYAE